MPRTSWGGSPSPPHTSPLSPGVSAGQISQLFNGEAGARGGVDGLMRRQNLHLEPTFPSHRGPGHRATRRPTMGRLHRLPVVDDVEALRQRASSSWPISPGCVPTKSCASLRAAKAPFRHPTGHSSQSLTAPSPKALPPRADRASPAANTSGPPRPATLAIGVLTRLHGDGLLFRNQAGVLAKHLIKPLKRVERFIPIANSISSAVGLGASHHIPGRHHYLAPLPPHDPTGTSLTSQMDTTAALRTYLDPRTSMLYSGTKHSGLDSSIDKGTSRAVAHPRPAQRSGAARLRDLRTRVQNKPPPRSGTRQSSGAQMLTKARENLIKRNPQWQIFDNPAGTPARVHREIRCATTKNASTRQATPTTNCKAAAHWPGFTPTSPSQP